jgi:cobalt-zinc-cadmium efflux system protein
MLHIIGDLLGSVAAIAAALVILFTGWTPIDPILSILVALLILRSAWHLVKKAAHILMEGVPDTIDVEELKSDLVAAVPGLLDAHHIHVWLLTAERPLLTMHATVDDHSDAETVLAGIKARLLERHGIDHSTVQVESGQCADEGPDHRH